MGRRNFAILGLASLVVAALGIALLVAGPATAGDDPVTCEAGTSQGLVSSSLGV